MSCRGEHHMKLNLLYLPSLLRPAWKWWAWISVYQIAMMLGHLQVSIWLVKGRAFVIDGKAYSYSYAMVVPYVVIAACILLLRLLWRMSRSAESPRRMGAYWLAWCFAVYVVDKELTYSLNEAAHYPQYGLLAWMLAQAIDPGRTRWPIAKILVIAVLCGVLDESLQYTWITRSYGDYFDFNDVLVNLLGASAGVMVYYGFRARPMVGSSGLKRQKRELLVKSSACVVGGVAIALCWLSTLSAPAGKDPVEWVRAEYGKFTRSLERKPNMYGSRQPSRRQEEYLVLGPAPAMAFMAGWLMLMTTFPGRSPIAGRRRLRSQAACGSSPPS